MNISFDKVPLDIPGNESEINFQPIRVLQLVKFTDLIQAQQLALLSFINSKSNQNQNK